MSYKCKICASNDVENPGDICEICAIGVDPYAASLSGTMPSSQGDNSEHHDTDCSSTKSGRKILLNGGDSIENHHDCDDMTCNQNMSVHVYSAGEVPQNATSIPNNNSVNNAAIPQYATSGITKNICVDTQERTFLTKWFASLFKGIPFPIDNEITMFQVFPDYSGTALNSMGNACDQVIVYGRLNNGAVSENNDVEVYGRRDSNNNIIARMIRNKASGTTIYPMRCMPASAVWVITALVLALMIALIMGLGVEGIIWTVVIVLCVTNLPAVLKIFGVIFGIIFSLFKRLF